MTPNLLVLLIKCYDYSVRVCGADGPGRTRLEVSTIAEIARVVSLLSVPDKMINGGGSETRFR
jgi:hypothetical protein